ncbi:MAG: hypothetical protein AAGF10_01740 [Verrucomicrobiota bacterium]
MAKDPKAASASAVDQVNLAQLVGHSHAVASTLPLELVQKAFSEHRYSYMAVLENGRTLGLCSR